MKEDFSLTVKAKAMKWTNDFVTNYDKRYDKNDFKPFSFFEHKLKASKEETKINSHKKSLIKQDLKVSNFVH